MSDKKTVVLFLMAFLVLTFGCKGGGALHGLGKGLATAAKVATVVAAATPRSSGGAPRERADVERSGSVALVRSDCHFVCPVEVDGDLVYVCAEATVFVDPVTNQTRTAMVCEGDLP